MHFCETSCKAYKGENPPILVSILYLDHLCLNITFIFCQFQLLHNSSWNTFFRFLRKENVLLD